ncbi:efflux RND transporter periplasmic adaptor subunit [Litorivivens sp.]|uniref:efflux RND transporter periplasmic adaptor subunit n=1 Tax=Litorivivens sp. TaxID=2020868 RepID=UPI003561EFC9
MTNEFGRDIMKITTTLRYFLLATFLTLPAQQALAGADHDNGASDHSESVNHDDAEHEHDEGTPSTTISKAMASRNGIRTGIAGPGTIERHLKVYGRLELPPDQRIEVRARFAGLVKSVSAGVGQQVSKGEVLAIIESNDSLKDYAIRAPIAGVIQSRQTSVGEISGSAPLFTVVDTRQLWATLQVFSAQRFEVKPGLAVHVVHNGHRHDSTLESLAPAGQGEPYILARVLLGNPEGDMAPGDLVSGEIDAETIKVSLVVENRALQQLEGNTVVFVQQGDEYHARVVKTGRTDGRHTEVLAGLDVGVHYVVESSYLIKADIEKSGASHEH